jgi:hypothetical protein
MIRPHIGVFTDVGWEIIHILSCPGDLRECPVTLAAREITVDEDGFPIGVKYGRWEVDTVTNKSGIHLVLGSKVGPEAGLGFSRRTGYSYKQSNILPRGL